MILPDLPTDIETTYPDRSPGDSAHQQHHDAIHQAFKDLNAAGGVVASGDLVFSVKDYGAKGDAATDDTAAIQDALNASAGAGIVFFPPGIYVISSTLTLPNKTTIQGPGKPLYPNFTTDYGTVTPSWGMTAATIQRNSGHGPIFTAGDSVSIDGMVIRTVVGGAGPDTTDTVFATGPGRFNFTNNVVQQMYALAVENTKSWGAGLVAGNQFTACAKVIVGVLVDCRFESNVATSCTDNVVTLTNGAGSNRFSGNRFEWGTADAMQFQTGSRNNIVTGNVFDAHAKQAIQFVQCTDENVVVGNLFWRNGRSMTGDSYDCHIRLFASSGQVINDNVFRFGGPDAGATWSGPNAVVGLESCLSKKSRFHGNSTRLGSKSSLLVKDRYGTSVAALDVDTVDMPAGVSPNTTSDDFSASLGGLSKVIAGPAVVFVHESRYVVGYNVVKGITLRGINAPTLTNSSGALQSLAGADALTYGVLAYSMRGGLVFASGQPNGFRNDGRWSLGQTIWNSAPAAGGNLGWILVAEGSPDTWKTFGTISA